MARSLRSKRLQRNRSVRRQKFYEREKQKLWELAKKVSEREEVETAKEEAGTRAGTVLDDAPMEQQGSQDQQTAKMDESTQCEVKPKLSKSALKKLKARRKMKKLGIKKGHFYF